MLDTEAIKEEGYRRELTRRMSAELDILISKARYAKSSILARRLDVDRPSLDLARQESAEDLGNILASVSSIEELLAAF